MLTLTLHALQKGYTMPVLLADFLGRQVEEKKHVSYFSREFTVIRSYITAARHTFFKQNLREATMAGVYDANPTFHSAPAPKTYTKLQQRLGLAGGICALLGVLAVLFVVPGSYWRSLNKFEPTNHIVVQPARN